jgi:2-polyprenyl-3-methyl-5-hydroxy-6-metoxy-1,4-benzoquinol methylase
MDQADGSVRSLADRVGEATIGLFDIATIYLGERLGLYPALHAGGLLTAEELAARTGTRERFVREWCEQQAASGILTCPNPDAEPERRRFELPPAHAEVLARRDGPAYAAGGLRGLVTALAALPDLPAALRVAAPARPGDAAGRDLAEGVGEANRPVFRHLLAGWLAALPEVDARLRASPPGRILDVGCGAGWSSIAIATAYPLVRVDGVDPDERAIAVARDHAVEAGLADRVRFTVGDGVDQVTEGPFDLVTLFETVHDMTHPVAVLAACRRSLAPGATCLVADARVAERFTLPAGWIDRIAYGWSVVDCLPAVLDAEGSSATGAVMRPATLVRYARDAGFAGVEILPIEDPGWRFYRLVP